MRKGSVLLFRTQHSQPHPQYWPWGLTWYCNLSPAPNPSSSPKINVFPKVQESLKPQLLFLPRQLVLPPTKLQWCKNISGSGLLPNRTPAPKLPLPRQVPSSITRNETADSWFQTLASSYPARKLLMKSKHTGREYSKVAVQSSRSWDTGWLGRWLGRETGKFPLQSPLLNCCGSLQKLCCFQLLG